jgi:hypothetical protein
MGQNRTCEDLECVDEHQPVDGNRNSGNASMAIRFTRSERPLYFVGFVWVISIRYSSHAHVLKQWLNTRGAWRLGKRSTALLFPSSSLHSIDSVIAAVALRSNICLPDPQNCLNLGDCRNLFDHCIKLYCSARIVISGPARAKTESVHRTRIHVVHCLSRLDQSGRESRCFAINTAPEHPVF